MVLIGVCRHFLQRSKTAAGEPGGPCHPPPTTRGPSSAVAGSRNHRKRPIVIPPNFRAELSFHGVWQRPLARVPLSTVQKVPRHSHARVPPLAPPSARESLALSHAGPRGGDAQQLSGQ